MITRTSEQTAPLDEVMLAMDVVDELRHHKDLVARELDASAREADLIARLRTIYHDQGIAVPDHILKEGVSALAQSRFVYTPPPDTLAVRLARLYVTRGRWGRPVLLGLAALLVALLAYLFVYQPFERDQIATAQYELAEGLPARMEELFDRIYSMTMVQSAVEMAEPVLERGKAAAAAGDREAAESALARLVEIHDTLMLEYTLRIVNREGEQTGVWTFPEINTDATNYYIVVEAIDPDGNVLTLPIENEETGAVEDVPIWAVRVPETLYESIRADRLDDGIIQRNIMGIKQFGFLEISYLMPVMDGAITRW